MKIAFFLLHYPVFSETFVSKEILTLQNLGVDGLIVCEKINHQPPFHPHIKKIKYPLYQITSKIIGPIFFKILSAHIYYLFHHPRAYFSSLSLLFSFFNLHHLRVFIKSPLLAKYISKNHIDLIYAHEIDSPCLYALICARLCQIPCGLIIHTQYLFAQNKFLKSKINNADFIIFQSKYSLKQAQKISSLPPKLFHKCHVLSTPGIDTEFFRPPQKLNYPQQIRLISIGRLEEAKGYPLLLESIKILKAQYPNIKLSIIGDGSQKKQLQNFINQNNLKKNVNLFGYIGHQTKLISLLHQHQYFILPSIRDSQNIHDVHPNVVKEAMSCGLITITSKLGGITEIIKNKQNAFLIKKITSKNLATIITLVHSLPPKEKINISRRARLSILNHHQQEKVCSQLKQIFTQYLYEQK